MRRIDSGSASPPSPSSRRTVDPSREGSYGSGSSTVNPAAGWIAPSVRTAVAVLPARARRLAWSAARSMPRAEPSEAGGVLSPTPDEEVAGPIRRSPRSRSVAANSRIALARGRRDDPTARAAHRGRPVVRERRFLAPSGLRARPRGPVTTPPRGVMARTGDAGYGSAGPKRVRVPKSVGTSLPRRLVPDLHASFGSCGASDAGAETPVRALPALGATDAGKALRLRPGGRSLPLRRIHRRRRRRERPDQARLSGDSPRRETGPPEPGHATPLGSGVD